MDGRTGSITVTALVGTGLATLAVSLTGVAGLSGDLQAAALKGKQTVPSLTPTEELRDTGHRRGYVLRDACDRQTAHNHGDRAPGTTGRATTPTVPTTPAATTPPAREF